MVLALDHYNYGRWMPVHLRGMASFPTSIKDELEVNGNWVARKTLNRFSVMAIDQDMNKLMIWSRCLVVQ